MTMQPCRPPYFGGSMLDGLLSLRFEPKIGLKPRMPTTDTPSLIPSCYHGFGAPSAIAPVRNARAA